MEALKQTPGFTKHTLVDTTSISVVGTATRDADGKQVVLKISAAATASHEFSLLQELAPYGITPAPLAFVPQGPSGCIVMTVAKGSEGATLQRDCQSHLVRVLAARLF